MKLRTIVTLILVIVTAVGEYKLGHTIDANIFLASFFIVLGLSRS